MDRLTSPTIGQLNQGSNKLKIEIFRRRRSANSKRYTLRHLWNLRGYLNLGTKQKPEVKSKNKD